MNVNPEQIIFLTFQMRQLEIHRNENATTKAQKESMTMQIHALKSQLDPLLMAYSEEMKERPAVMNIEKKDANKDLGPTEVVEALHAYAKMKLIQPDVLKPLVDGKLISIAGTYNDCMYLMHFEAVTPMPALSKQRREQERMRDDLGKEKDGI